MYKILIVEDDLTIANTLKAQLENWGYEAQITEDFKHVLTQFAAFSPHLVLLDITLPAFNGYHWCAEIRKISKVPVVFLSSASDNMNIVMAITQGGDDFVAKPFDLNVLMVKIQAILRRAYDFAGQTDFLECRGAILNVGDASLTYEGKTAELTKNEFRILGVLLQNKGKAVSRNTLMARLWETDSFIDDNTLTVNVTRLRKKLEELGMDGWIKTKKGLGYLVE